MASDVDKAFNKSMRRLMGPGWKPPSPLNLGVKARKKRAKTHSNRDNANRQADLSTVEPSLLPDYRADTPGGKKYLHNPRRAIPRALHKSPKGDPSRGVDKYGRPTHTKEGHLILRLR